MSINETDKLSSSQEEYLKKEYDKLNSEVEKLMEETRSREKYVLTILAAIAAWICTNIEKKTALLCIISMIPFITTLIYGISVFFLYKNIGWIGIYLLRIENYFFKNKNETDGSGWGWEKYFSSADKKKKFVTVTYVLWFFELLLTILLILFVLKEKCFL
jgi:hypothetical protein